MASRGATWWTSTGGTRSRGWFGLDLGAVIRATVWLSDIKLMGPFNEVYRSYFDGALPVRSTVEAKLSNAVDVEIAVTAWAPRGAQV